MSTQINLERTAEDQLTSLAKETWEQRNLWWSIYETMSKSTESSTDETETAYFIYLTLQNQYEELSLLIHLAQMTNRATPPWTE